MKSLKLYLIDDDYIKFLRKFDKKVPYNKVQKRPYVGVVFYYNKIKYFAPLTSPKLKHLKINSNAVVYLRLIKAS